MIDFFYQYGLFGLFIAGFLSGSIFPFLTILFMIIGKIARYLAVIGLLKTVM